MKFFFFEDYTPTHAFDKCVIAAIDKISNSKKM